jgi:UDP-N-acetylglucosamine--N-acetylmuramyl-(pentapeptide) pyrophosphoryl-undecaprenol N-acetylglucosamine transferase
MRVLISGGGTGGHIYPALAVAHVLKTQYGAEILYLGDVRGLETQLVPKAGFPFVGIQAGKLRRYLSLKTFADLGRIPVSFAQAIRHVRRFQPDVAFTSGGYVSVPAGYAARSQRVPLVIHQQDVSPNLANRLLRPMATRITVSFEDSLRYFPPKKSAWIGNPVREAILQVASMANSTAKQSFGLDPALPLVLVTGGSQGAKHLNEVVAASLPGLLRVCQVLQISGSRTYAATKEQAEAQLQGHPEWAARYQLYEYLDEQMAPALAAADVVLCRSGAATLSELATLGKPSILVPLPPGFGGSPQAVNAAMFQQRGAAKIIRDADLTPEQLSATLLPIVTDESQRSALGKAALSLARPQAAADLAELVVQLARRQV